MALQHVKQSGDKYSRCAPPTDTLGHASSALSTTSSSSATTTRSTEVRVMSPPRTSCSCIGAQRSFSPSTGACVCDSGYAYFNEAGQQDSDADDTVDCQLIVSQ